jgi:hypothetical protein
VLTTEAAAVQLSSAQLTLSPSNIESEDGCAIKPNSGEPLPRPPPSPPPPNLARSRSRSLSLPPHPAPQTGAPFIPLHRCIAALRTPSGCRGPFTPRTGKSSDSSRNHAERFERPNHESESVLPSTVSPRVIPRRRCHEVPLCAAVERGIPEALGRHPEFSRETAHLHRPPQGTGGAGVATTQGASQVPTSRKGPCIERPRQVGHVGRRERGGGRCRIE